ncbi:sensor histidine kinase [Cellulomonas sp. S1-8]|uniref:sensor histidine kinase n=1 Tax=Cellulomonas sp. S1-8 TaxID=2904790 RepID=UPI0022437956|nr:sensor histidine kinase [Cellulomonas sp. S1-8]UZN02035.1 sensor histidine kinase [Cellulomonas sp. S1-8]
MTAGSAEAPFQHELVLHDGTAALVDLLLPFIRDGVEGADRIVLVGEPAFVDEMLAAVPDVPGILAVPESGRGRFPARAMRRLRRLLSSLDATGVRVRVVNQVPHMTPDEWHEWRRYEAAANRVLGPDRVWGTCAYDTGQLDDGMQEDLVASHPHVLTATGRHPSEAFTHLDDHIGRYLDLPPHPIEATAPQLSLPDPSAAAARRAIHELGVSISLPTSALDASVLAVSETVTNSLLHGRPPVRLKAWTRDGRLTVAVSDGGTGPHPLVGLLPAPLGDASGRGMWILHQMLDDVRHRIDHDGYTVRFSVSHDVVATSL